MPRRKSVNIIRNVGVDPVYGLEHIQKFINIVMWRGKKNVARKIVYEAFNIIAKKQNKTSDEVIDIFNQAVVNSTPLIEVKARRLGGSVFQVPVEVVPMRGLSLAFKNIVNSAKGRSGNSFEIKLAAELLDAAENKGGAVKSKLEKHKMADANKAFSHLTW
jgi:small subunit ribosomal protein S7